jgi:hypothetical protein
MQKNDTRTGDIAMNRLKITYSYDGSEGCNVAKLQFGNVTASISENTRYLADDLIDGRCPLMAPSYAKSCFEKLDVSDAVAKSQTLMCALRTLFVYDDSGSFQTALDSRYVQRIEFDVDIKNDKSLEGMFKDSEFSAINSMVKDPGEETIHSGKARVVLENGKEGNSDRVVKIVLGSGENGEPLSNEVEMSFSASRKNCETYELNQTGGAKGNKKVIDVKLNPGIATALDAIFDTDEDAAFNKLLRVNGVEKVSFDVSLENDEIYVGSLKKS